MKRTQRTPEQIVAKLREADARLAASGAVAPVVQVLLVNEQADARWRAQHGGMKADAPRRLKGTGV